MLREYARLVPVTRPYFTVGPQDPASRFAAEPTDHPVFRLLDDGHPDRLRTAPRPGAG